MKDKQKRKKERTWAEAARMVIYCYLLTLGTVCCRTALQTMVEADPNKAAS